jgi:hypothetical protein
MGNESTMSQHDGRPWTDLFGRPLTGKEIYRGADPLCGAPSGGRRAGRQSAGVCGNALTPDDLHA